MVKYAPDTGDFYTDSKRKVGWVAHNGYYYVHYLGKQVLAHRLAFFLTEGEWPPDDVDHINGNRTDNRMSNLRKVSRSQNLFNRNKNLHKTLPKNVYSRGSRFMVKMKIGGVTTHFGYYDDLELAVLVAEEAQRKHHKEYALVNCRG